MTQTALITGASAGLGEQFAWLCAEDKYDLILVARSKDALEKLKRELEASHNISVTVLIADLADPKAITQLATQIMQPIDLLINNAGFGDYGFFKDLSLERQRDMIQVNVMALTLLSKLVLSGMIKRKRGKILNVASTASFQPGPLMTVYYATKAYVLNFSLALGNECKGTGVTVTCLCPGPTATKFARAANMEKSKLFMMGIMGAKEVAEIGYKACMRGKALIIPGRRNKFLAFMTRFAPRVMAAAVARKAQESRRSN